MDLLRTQKIRFLTNLYRDMKLPMNKDKRLIFLNRAMNILLNEKDKNIDELLPLMSREIELLNRNVDNANLEILRQRQLLNFVAFIKNQKNEEKKIQAESKICKECKNVRLVTEFTVHTRQDEINVCKNCSFLKFPRIDATIYRAILRAIRRDERDRNSLSSYAFIVQEEDIKQIIETVWHGHSILTQCDNRKELRLPRWNRALDWSPWNCVLLTEAEARHHNKLADMESVYGVELIRNIESKHMLGKLLFRKLRDVNYDFVQSGDWWTVGLDGKTL